MSLSGVTAADVAAYGPWRQSQTYRGRLVGVPAANRDLAALKALFAWLVDTERWNENPTLKVKLAREHSGTREVVIVDPGVFERIAGRLSERWASAAVALLGTGARWSSLAKLRQADLVERREVTEGKLVARRVVRFVRTKGKRAIEIPIADDRVWSALRYCARQQWSADVGGFDAALGEACDAAGVPRVTAHMLRHTFAVTCLRNGADIRQVQMWLGHQSLKTTELYLRWVKSEAPPMRLDRNGK